MSEENKTTTQPVADADEQARRETPAPESLLQFVGGAEDTAHPGPAASQAEAQLQQTTPAAEPAPDLDAARPRPMPAVSVRGARSILGVDLGQRTLKLVHVEVRGDEVRLVDAAVSDLLPLSDTERLRAVSKEVGRFLAGARPRVRVARCAISGPGTATVCASFPKMPGAELEQAVRWKLAEAAGIDAETAVSGHYVVGAKGKSGSVDVVGVAAPGDAGELTQLFPHDSPRLEVVIPEATATENVILAAYPQPERSPLAVLDIGATASKLSVVGAEGLEFSRELPVGGDSVTAALVGRMSIGPQTVEISRQTAEHLKQQYRIGQTEPVTVMGAAIPGARLLGAIRPALERLASELVRSLQFYAQSHNQAKVESVLVCGGGAVLAGLPEYLTKETHVPTTLLDPWRALGLQVSSGVTANAALFAVATGAAIHDAAKVNLLPPHVRARRLTGALRTGSVVVTACVLAALLGLAWTASRQRAAVRAALQTKQQAAAPMESLATKIEDARRYQAEAARRRELLRSLGVGAPMHAAILKELSNIMPEGTYLAALSFPRQNGVRKVKLHVEIYALPTVTAAQLKQDLIAALERSPFFANVSFQPLSGPRAGAASAPHESIELVCQVLGFPGGR